jgi:hypothetical protein
VRCGANYWRLWVFKRDTFAKNTKMHEKKFWKRKVCCRLVPSSATKEDAELSLDFSLCNDKGRFGIAEGSFLKSTESWSNVSGTLLDESNNTHIGERFDARLRS